MNLTDAVDFEYSEKDMIKPLKNITLAEADSTETFKFKPFEYERGIATRTAKGVINTIRDMQDLPEQVKIFGKRLSFGFGGYFGDTEEETERKKLNLITAERNLNEQQAERYRFTSPKETESLAYGIGGGVVNYGTMLISAGLAGGALKAAKVGAKAIGAGAEAAGLGTMSVMELAGQVQDKTPEKDGEIDIEAMTPEWARKATGGTLAYTAISAVTEKYVGFGQQMRMWSKPISWGGDITSKALTTLKTAGKNALSEGATEGIQDLEATGIGLLDGTLEMDKLPARLQQAWKSAIIGGIIGGGVGTAAAMKSARNVKKQLRDMVAPVVGEEEAQTVAEAIYDAGTDNMTQAISIELELSSELKNKHGKVWNSMLSAVSKEMEGKPRFEAMTEDERAHYANTVAKHFADNVLAEANFRGTTIDGILRASDITYDKGIKIARHINVFDALKNPDMIPEETKLKRESLLAFLKRKGGLRDEGGELKSRDARKGYPGLVNNKGMNFDDAALLAWEHGYFIGEERPDINEFLEAIDEGLRGNHRYNVEEENTFRDYLDNLEIELEKMGIDWENMTAAEIEKAVNDIPEMQSLEREAEFYANYEPIVGMDEDEAEQFAIETEGKEYPVISDEDLPFYYQLAEENAQLDAENPAYEGETINIDGQERTVYNSEGERIAQSEAALRNFYKWFGDSKVVDEQGRPLVVYHGTNAEFDTFLKEKQKGVFLGKAFYFTDSLEAANTYAEGRAEKGGKAKIMPVYLKAEKIFKWSPNFEEMAKQLNITEDDFKKLSREDVTKLAEDKGYDGFFKEMYVGGKGYYGVFNSNQIKSTSNRGTFDIDNPNIYYQEGDEYNPREKMPKVRGGWTKAKILRYLKEWPSRSGVSNATRMIAEFDSVEDFKNNMFYHGSKYGTSKGMKPSITMSDREVERIGGGGYGEKYWAISLSKSKKVAGTFATAMGSGNIYPVLLAKNANVIEMPELSDSADLDDYIEKLYNDGVDAVWIGDKDKGEQELAVINPRAIVNIGTSQFYRAYKLGQPENPINIKSDEEIQKIYDFAKEYARKYPRHAPDEAVQEARGIVYWQDGDENIYGATNSDEEPIANPENFNIFIEYLQRGKNAKGFTNITPDDYIIKLLEDADESTLPHEFAHYWLTEMWNYTRTGRASENYMKRWQIISDYLGVTPEQTRLTREQQEKFASSYEAYLTRGELPTPLIGSVFDDYDKWLQRVYSDYNKINYQSGKGKRRVRLTDAAIKFFQSMTTGTLEPPALAPKDTGVTIPEKVETVPETVPVETVEAPTTYDTTRVINITEGEKGVSKVYQREAMKHADRIVDELGVSYNKINLEEQAIKASEWVQNNLEEARKVVNGAAAPEGIIDTAIFIAYENEMLRIGNNEEYQRALKIHSQVQTQRGQAIAAERITTDDVYNPAYWWKKLQNHKEKQVAQQLFKGDVKALNEAIETETKSIMKQIAGKPRDEQVKELTKLAEKLQKDYNLNTLYQMPDDINERTVKEFIKDTIGVNPDVMAGNEVINKAEQLQKLWENTKDKSGNPSVEAMRAKRELNDLIQAQTPSNALAIWTSIFGRGIMLTSVKSPVLNIISNIEAGFTEGITRRLMYGTTEKAVDKSVKQEFSKYAWEVYKASSDIVTTMNDYDDDMRIIGEQILHSQGQGAFRAASRKVEEISFKYLMGAPDVIAKTYAFNDTADLLATKIAREEGAADISKRATEIYKDAILIKPVTEQGQAVRKQAQEQAHYTTFTNDSWAAKFGLSARNWLNMVGKNKVRLGDLTMKFVKTPANVQMMGLEYGFGLLYTAYHVQDIIKNPQSETSKIAIRAAVRNGLGIALAALLYSMLDPDDYFSEFDTLNPREKDRMRAMGAMPNSIKIGNRWVSLDYFGQLGIPLVGMLEAHKNKGLRSYVQSGLTQAAKIPGIKETKQLIDSMSEYARYDLKPEKIAQMMAGTVLDQARAMTIPAIVNDIAKMTDDYERDTMGGVMDKVIASIPGLRRTLPERYGIQGLVKTEPGLSTLLFGSRVKTAQESKLVREVNKLSKKDEQPSISDVTKYGDLRLLSPEKKVKVRQEFYKLYNTESKKLISTRDYQNKSDADKKKALNKVRSRVVKTLKQKYSNDIQREKRRR